MDSLRNVANQPWLIVRMIYRHEANISPLMSTLEVSKMVGTSLPSHLRLFSFIAGYSKIKGREDSLNIKALDQKSGNDMADLQDRCERFRMCCEQEQQRDWKREYPCRTGARGMT